MSGKNVYSHLNWSFFEAFSFLVGVSSSYDLDMDTRLAEETTTLVESYTVRETRDSLTTCLTFYLSS
jgi:hypothetical protein